MTALDSVTLDAHQKDTLLQLWHATAEAHRRVTIVMSEARSADLLALCAAALNDYSLTMGELCQILGFNPADRRTMH